jgi:hypothetical protein
MRLSELSTDAAASVLVSITPALSNILKDPDLREKIGKKADLKDMSVMGVYLAGVDKINELIPFLLDTHKGDIYTILAILNETTAAKIAEQNILVTMTQIREIVKDKDLIDFFRSWAGTEQTA